MTTWLVVGSSFDDACHIPASHKLSDHVELVRIFTQVKHGNDVRVKAEAAHNLRLSGDSGSGDFIQALGLDQGEGYFSVQQGVLSQVDPLLAALAFWTLPPVKCAHCSRKRERACPFRPNGGGESRVFHRASTLLFGPLKTTARGGLKSWPNWFGCLSLPYRESLLIQLARH